MLTHTFRNYGEVERKARVVQNLAGVTVVINLEEAR